MIKLKEQKEYSEHKAIKDASLPKKAFIGLSQHFGKICSPIVSVKDYVLAGQKIATADSGVFSPIHSSVSGNVSSIKDYLHPVLGRCKTIIIDNDSKDEHVKDELSVSRKKEEIEKIPNETLKNLIFEAGIVGLGGAGFPTHIKLSVPKPVDSFILNGAECEPCLTADSRLMQENAYEIIRGMDIVMRILNIKNSFVAIEDNKPEAIKKMQGIIKNIGYKLKILKSSYPQGGEKQLIKSVLNREVPSGGLPFDVGVVVHNVATVFAIYEAIYKNKPLYERVITVTGSCLENPMNLKVRIGTTIKEVIDECGPLKEEPIKVIVGGPMMGIAQYSLDAPVIKGTSGIILLGKKEVKIEDEKFCIRCGRCIEYCPVGLMPSLINLATLKEDWELAKIYGALDCIECGVCSYVCPSKIDLVQSIKYAKLGITKKRG
ncbi:MAG: electron transport complex subunit RsxC [Candidatus Omnitrophica bacterium]|nr:electron transport complex subunit RsxC [Candidatus Omnitrophota bacterium]